MKQALVTGGGGFVGLAVVRLLREMGIRTLVVGRHHYPEVEAVGGISLKGDIRDPAFLTTSMAGCDTVFHVAALAGIWGPWDDYYSINVRGTQNVIAACEQNKVARLVYTSTPSVVFNGESIQGLDESLPYAKSPLCHYAATKIMAEKLVLQANGPELMTTALRPHLVWGPGDTNLIPRLLARGRQGALKIVGDGQNRVDISYIDNVAQAHIAAAGNLEGGGGAAGQPFFISQGEPVLLWDWINELFSRLAIPPVTKRVSFLKAYRVGWLLEKVSGILRRQSEPPMTRFLAEQLAKSHWFAIDRAREVLDYSPQVTSEEGMERLLAWLKREEQR
ncbi:MAG: NAD-dependent epimerase/dehydratase family protein [Thermodesulfobacteriota bacterium]